MQTDLSPALQNTPEGKEAQRLLANCVHCGFCTATCPTYQILGDELDGPRGRIYLIKQMAEGRTATVKTREHLDRCLTCRNCESTCPSGVQYGHLLDIGRKWAEEQAAPRPIKEQAVRWLLKEGLTRPNLFNPAMKIGRFFKPVLPKVLQKKIPDSPVYPDRKMDQQIQVKEEMLFLEGCVQPGMLPNINQATERVLAKLGIRLIAPPSVSCCGALRFHLNDHEKSYAQMQNNIDAWYPLIQSGQVKTLLINASGCGVAIKDYGYYFKDHPEYAEKAKVISEACLDISEVLEQKIVDLKERINLQEATSVIYHPPCTLQHGQQIRGKVELVLTAVGVKVNLCQDSHLCCGSAGTYSILQEKLSTQLREQKLENLLSASQEHQASTIISGNVGCITHLQNDAMPVKHWIEILDDLLV
ncbi:glycolate oxidase subunit GlcF [Polynucleobacter rarus]|uniref:glycolate oxidase subunit GlcF n=1 Tax=Polynucleobacter rarus TaxID=556055 RepID=UPI000D3E1666|nr:glycolate oxidase subunit GlcF [Polynucleobacter rarus]